MDEPFAKTVFSNQQMVDADRATIAAGTPGEVLMERAGAAVAAEIMRHYDPQAVLVLCGPGNNGGDGFVIARLLAEAGWDVSVQLLGDKAALRGDAATAASKWPGVVQPLDARAIGDQLVVDALFGTGLTRDVEGMAAHVLQAVLQAQGPVIAVDIPSGVDGNSGQVRGVAVPATFTVTFHRPNYGHLLQPGRELCGDLYIADIGIQPDAVTPTVWENDPSLWVEQFPFPQADSHKYTRGHVLVQGGPKQQSGAARLAAQAALRVCGAVSVVCDVDVLPIYASALQAVMTKLAADDAAFQSLLEDKHTHAFTIGPGAGVNAQTRNRALSALNAGMPTVLDADAISVFAEDRQALFDACRQAPTILTPHMGEFARLFGDVEGDKLQKSRKAAHMAQAIIVLKGSDTVIAHPDGRAVINTATTPYLATAGAGDVLTGLCAGLLAGGMDAFAAACAAVWMHGMAGREFGPGLTADDLPDMISTVLEYLHFQK